jgi:sensor histidine kinase regulating citrate/malate metabolism
MALTIIINLLVAYIIVMQIFRIMKGVENKNSADSGEKAQATATIKNGIIVIVLTSLIGAVGFNMFL